jgi:flagellar motor switch protein FliG
MPSTLLRQGTEPGGRQAHSQHVIEHQVYQQPFAFLQKTETENLLTFIQDEHPQTIALVLAHLPRQQGSRFSWAADSRSSSR